VTCVCGLGESNETCCLPIIKGKTPAKTAEALMRARYAAYVLAEVDFIIDSVHPNSPGEADRRTTEAWSKNADWKGLEVVSTEAGGEGDEQGIVEFIARFDVQGAPQQHHERARFVRHNKKWMYMDGEEIKPQPIRRAAPRVGRNDPCPCGSGKKFKKCYPACPNPFPADYVP
jgi:SEC-C motif-containing protein